MSFDHSRRRQALQRPLATPRPPVPEQLARSIIARIVALNAAGADPESVLFAIDREMPSITLRDLCGAIALLRAESGQPGYLIVPAKVN
jgi:hypothetical protein